MNHKRKRKESHTVALKKSKCCYFPFQVRDIVKRIAFYLEGDHLKNFKLTCKEIEKSIKEMSCATEITWWNFKRVTDTPGYHIIKFNGNEAGFNVYFEYHRKHFYSEVKHLILDHGGINTEYVFDYQALIDTVENLSSLRIIRCVDMIDIQIGEHLKLNSLEIYTTKSIELRIHKEMKRLLLCSTEEETKDYSNIDIRVQCDEYSNHNTDIKYCAAKTNIKYTNEYHFMNHHYRSNNFVPNLAYLA